ncbi:copper-binding protein [Pseudomonas soli]|jgi:Cu(I)/Ag(I) efflux system protein CusF|uniref:copper-binding protein n=1 Tax=Pseudomonas soli TaxID=1306993 RepID=UPI001E4B3C58|nr:copper-binding protein [Pseudomonas soli]MDT3713704.1 copper-binding protein [Pseudomonas soli]MDT3729235.1 copper-binding protein [Pseudomonas soli]WJO21968.1 copper-binding protein [Pseudomonas soli]
MKNVNFSALLMLAFATGAQAQASMEGMDMKNMPMEGMDMKTEQAVPVAHAEGTIKAIDVEQGKVTLAHGPVATLKWPAMTMVFRATAQQLEGLKVGDKVRFGFRMQGSTTTIVDIRKE